MRARLGVSSIPSGASKYVRQIRTRDFKMGTNGCRKEREPYLIRNDARNEIKSCYLAYNPIFVAGGARATALRKWQVTPARTPKTSISVCATKPNA